MGNTFGARRPVPVIQTKEDQLKAAIARIRFRKKRRCVRYNEAHKALAIRLFEEGYSCRRVAAIIGPTCSSGTPIRWRKEAIRRRDAQLRLENMIANNHRL